MGKIDYQKILKKIIEDEHHNFEKIEKVVFDSRNNNIIYNYASLSFAEIVNDKEWSISEKERLLRLFSHEKYEYKLEYYDEYNNKKEMDAYAHMIKFDNLSGFTAYMNCFNDKKYIRDNKYKSILNVINNQASKEQKLEFMKAALSILDEEDKKRLCADFYEAFTIESVSNESIFINIIKTCSIELIDEYVPYIDNISAYLSYAVATGNIEVVKHFLDDLGADINYYPKEGIYGLLTPLKKAIFKNDYEMFKFLLDYGADINLSVLEEDFIDNLHNTSLNIFHNVWHGAHYKDCKEDDEEVKKLQYLRTSTPLEYAITLKNKWIHEHNSTDFSIYFDGDENYVDNSVEINTVNHTDEQKNRAKIINLLFEKTDKSRGFDETNLICSALVTQDTLNINKYIDYVIENKIKVDIKKIFDIFLSLNLNKYEELNSTLINFVEKYSKNPSKVFKQLFEIYLKEKVKRYLSKKFILNDFTSTLLDKIDSSVRKNIILMPYVKDVNTTEELLKLGFDINQTDEDGKNILFRLLWNRYSYDELDAEEKKLFEFLTKINPETNKRLIDISHRDKKNKNALFYALQKIHTNDKYIYRSKEKVYTYTEFEDLVADFIDMLPAEEVNNSDVINVLEKRMTEWDSDFGEQIHAEFVYQHHKKLMEAFRRKLIFSDKIYQEIFERLYPNEEKELEVLNNRVQVEASLDFVYEVLDKNTEIQKLSIDKTYNKYITYLSEDDASFEEFLCVFRKIISDIDELNLFYEQNITKKYNREKFLKYVKNKYNVSYNDLSVYIFRMLIVGIKKYGSDKLPLILELCPGYDINTIVFEENIGMSYWQHLATITDFDEDGNQIELEGRYEATNIRRDWNDNIIFTGSLIHYGILINDIELVKYLKSVGASVKLIIEGEDYSWDYVNSNAMLDLIESEIGSKGPKDLDGFNEEEMKYLLNL